MRKGLKTQISPSLPRLVVLSADVSCLSFHFSLLSQNLPSSSAGVTLTLLVSERGENRDEVCFKITITIIMKKKKGAKVNKRRRRIWVETRGKGAAASHPPQHMPPVCLEYNALFLDPHGYFCICAGVEGGRKFTLRLNPCFETRIRRCNVSARAHSCARRPCTRARADAKYS